jgi:putative heme-binding domain-containing protein
MVEPPLLFTHIAAAQKDPADLVRFRAILVLGAFEDTASASAIAPGEFEIPLADLDLPWMRTAVSCATPSLLRDIAIKAAYFGQGGGTEAFLVDAFRILGQMMLASPERHGLNGETYLASLLHAHKTYPGNGIAGLRGLTQGLGSKGASPRQFVFRDEVKSWINEVTAQQREQALTSTLAMADRIRAIDFLALEDFPALQSAVAKLLQSTEPDAIRLAAIQLLRQKSDQEVASLLLEAWPTLTPAPREAAAQALASRTVWTDTFLTAVEKQQIKPSEVSPTIRASLQRLSNTKLRDRAAKLFAASGTRAEILARFQPALSLKGDATAGQLVYQTACAVCHKKGAEGRDLGPNLATILAWTPDQLLTNILDPNREVSPNFLLYAVELHDGRTVAGMITSETATSIALKGADGIEQNLARTDIKSLKSTGLSLMPEGLEAAITPQQMADLMAFLRR